MKSKLNFVSTKQKQAKFYLKSLYENHTAHTVQCQMDILMIFRHFLKPFFIYEDNNFSFILRIVET
jgi:hypothetical protein